MTLKVISHLSTEKVLFFPKKKKEKEELKRQGRDREKGRSRREGSSGRGTGGGVKNQNKLGVKILPLCGRLASVWATCTLKPPC